MGQPSGATPTRAPGQAADDRSLGEIVSAVTTDLSTLIKQEMDLAKVEMKEEFAKAGKGAGLLGGAGLAGYFTIFFLSWTLLFLLDNWMPIEVAALIITGVWAVVAAVLALTGRKALKESNPQLPKTQQTLKEDAAWARAQKS
ncbi:phage holin family protein [Nocardioides sp. zg-578]|uniref:Phage holin family protein n=1 Tax=Nocardioides marmotae TaxID=2663857 RepID=A0A6I3IYA6_9ACTN|nr:phage holin family protein [Nocardioides marmotae]MCR6030421.1 phage holin family protein [Gordonia jinghuaiqii]MTB85654.1 phage holin family protein [Nocardioides marmotae]MTB94057.1 phage holin family protein [Nocardioides marmotae]QKE03340.1 phage holin family protein [Nocardioides marmotae]